MKKRLWVFFNKSIKAYQYSNQSGGIAAPLYRNQVMLVRKYSDRIEIDEKHILQIVLKQEGQEEFAFYKYYDYATQQGIDFIAKSKISDYLGVFVFKDQLDTYRYTFQYNAKDNQYYSTSIQVVK